MKNQKAIVPVVVTDNSLTEKNIATALAGQYDAAVNSIKTSVQQVIRFGAMLIEAERIVFAEGKLHRGVGHSGEGLESWLAKNCPSVNYKTAMRWKQVAANACSALGCDESNGVRVLLGDAKGVSGELPVREIKERVDELYAAGSIRKLSQMCFDFAAEDRGGGRPKAEAKPLPKLKRRDEAKMIWNGVMQILSKNSVRDSIPLLDEKVTEICRDKLRDLLDTLEEHLKEF